MNVTEANAVAALLRFATGEQLPREHDDVDKLVEAARFLGERVHKALAAGPALDELERDLRWRVGELLLEDGDDYVEDAHADERPVDDVAVAGGRL